MRLKVERRLDLPKWASILVPIISVVVALVIMGLVIFIYEMYQPGYFKSAVRGVVKEYIMNIEKSIDKYKGSVYSWLDSLTEEEKEGEIKRPDFKRAALSGVASAYGNFTMKGLNEALRNYEEVYGFIKKLEGKKYEKIMEEYLTYMRALRKAKDKFVRDAMKSYYTFYSGYREKLVEWDKKVQDVVGKVLSGAATKQDLDKVFQDMQQDFDAYISEYYNQLSKNLDPFLAEVDRVTKNYKVSTTGWLAVKLAYKEMFTWPFTPSKGLYDSMTYMIPLLFIALGLILVFQMKLWNIGAEGQYYMGVVVATWMALFVVKNPHPAWVPIILLLSGIAGALWAAAAGALKAYLNMDEIVTTLMLNYIAFNFMEYLVYGPWKAPTNFPETLPIPRELHIPVFGTTRVNYGLILAFALTVVIYFIMKKTWWGFDLRVIGDNQTAARYSGINIKKNIILAMFVSGFMAGLAGGVQMLGFEHKLMHGYHPGYGYTGIIIAWLSRLNAWGTIIVSFLFGGLLVGGNQLQIDLKMPKAMIEVIQGVLLFSLLAAEVLFKYKIKVVKE